MKKTFMITILLLSFNLAFSNPITKCTKKYNLDVQKAYIVSYSALKVCKYKVLEIQSENGYILFEAGGREFLLETSPKGSETIIKIVPIDSDMTNITVQESVFKALDSEVLKAK